MRECSRLAYALTPMVVLAQGQAPPTVSPQAIDDPIWQELQAEALEKNPDLARGKSLVEAEKERIPQAKALPDPSLSLGIQNDGFKRIEIGRMETSWYQLMVTQPLPWPGKRQVRGDIAALGVDGQDAVLRRTRLGLLSDLRRAYVGLLLVRGQLQLLDDQGLFLQKAEATTKVRYEVGQGSQADLLRAQLERTRLQQTRLGLEAEEHSVRAAINRIRVADPDAPIATTNSLRALSAPDMRLDQAWLDQAEKESPELLQATIDLHQAERRLDLAKLDRKPDFAVSAAIMPRGGLEPMWQVGFSIGLPIFSKQKQQRAVAEQEWRRKAQGSGVETVRILLSQRIRERQAQLASTLATLRIYREGLLVQSEASFQAALAQYEAGQASYPFLSVLEALNGWVADQSRQLQTLAQAQALQIAQEEFNLGPTPGISSAGLSASAMGGSGGGPPAPGMGSSKPASSGATETGGPSTKSM